MKAITIREPWATTMVFGTRRIENRGTLPPRALMGQRVAIHAGAQITWRERDAVAPIVRKVGDRSIVDIRENLRMLPSSRTWSAPRIEFAQWLRERMAKPSLSSVIGVATLASVGGMDEAMRVGQAVWFTGKFAHVFEDVRPVWPPVPCPGRMNYWEVPARLVPTINERIKEPVA